MKQNLLALLAKYINIDFEKFFGEMKSRYQALNSRHQYYVRFILPFFFFWMILALFSLPMQGMLFLSLGYFYPLFLSTPGMDRMLYHKKYRLSLIKGIWILNQRLMSIFKKNTFRFKEEISSSLLATLFCFTLSLLSWDFYFLLAPMGSALYFYLAHQYRMKNI